MWRKAEPDTAFLGDVGRDERVGLLEHLLGGLEVAPVDRRGVGLGEVERPDQRQDARDATVAIGSVWWERRRLAPSKRSTKIVSTDLGC